MAGPGVRKMPCSLQRRRPWFRGFWAIFFDQPHRDRFTAHHPLHSWPRSSWWVRAALATCFRCLPWPRRCKFEATRFGSLLSAITNRPARPLGHRFASSTARFGRGKQGWTTGALPHRVGLASIPGFGRHLHPEVLSTRLESCCPRSAIATWLLAINSPTRGCWRVVWRVDPGCSVPPHRWPSHPRTIYPGGHICMGCRGAPRIAVCRKRPFFARPGSPPGR